jgi:hypothetical protein
MAVTIDGTNGVSGPINVTTDSIKLDGNYPVGSENTALGNGALDDGSLTGGNNVAIGSNSLTANTSGAYNTGVGVGSLFSNSSGSNNIAIGYQSLLSNSTGNGHAVVGFQAGYNNTTGLYNTYMGESTGRQNSTGGSNTAVGNAAMYSNTASYNTAMGYAALFANTTGTGNVAVGKDALVANTTGTSNTALGYRTAVSLTTGTNNNFIGAFAGGEVTTGSKNTILGAYNGNQGGLDIRTSSNNIVLSDGDGNPRAHCQSNAQWNFNSSSTNTVIHNLQHNAASPFGVVIDFASASPDNNSNYFLKCADSSTNRLQIYSDGDVVNHDNSYGAISDIKLKEQITDASSQWDDIKSLNVRKYKMKSDVAEKGDSNEHWRLGVIAQEVEEAGMSGLIKTSPDMIENEDGQLVESGEYTKQVKYSILYMKAVKALQEAMERIETLEAKVQALETN